MKKPPELSWQDKAILISLPVVVLIIFIVTNFLSQEPTIEDVFLKKQTNVSVRDAGRIALVYPDPASNTKKVRLKSYNNDRMEYDFILKLTASETFTPEQGRLIQFYGLYNYDKDGGYVTSPYKGKSNQSEGWVIYGDSRYPNQTKAPNESLPIPPQ